MPHKMVTIDYFMDLQNVYRVTKKYSVTLYFMEEKLFAIYFNDVTLLNDFIKIEYKLNYFIK